MNNFIKLLHATGKPWRGGGVRNSTLYIEFACHEGVCVCFCFVFFVFFFYRRAFIIFTADGPMKYIFVPI